MYELYTFRYVYCCGALFCFEDYKKVILVLEIVISGWCLNSSCHPDILRWQPEVHVTRWGWKTNLGLWWHCWATKYRIRKPLPFGTPEWGKFSSPFKLVESVFCHLEPEYPKTMAQLLCFLLPLPQYLQQLPGWLLHFSLSFLNPLQPASVPSFPPTPTHAD